MNLIKHFAEQSNIDYLSSGRNRLEERVIEKLRESEH
jgi:hypothetical protein